jgi:tetratricopeptide (TPR) repeat protein
LRHAEEAIALYPAATLARTCLTMVLRYNDVGAEYIAKATGELLALAPKNIIAAVLRANALSSLDRPREAATAWELVFDLRPDSLPLAIPAVEELMRLQQHQAVLRATEKLLATHKEDLPLRRLRFRAQIALKSWADAAALGDSLTVLDGEFDADSTYTARHVEALRLSGDTLSALARAARAVKQHPADLSIYLQYLNLINSENTTALPRGLERFPESSELNVIAAREAVSAGRRRAAIASLGTAVRQDPTLMQGFLQMAELWFEEQQPDSGIVAILRAPRTGTTDLLRAYSISRGRQMLRSATDTTTVGWRRSLALFALADSLESQAETRALIAAVTLSLARAELVIAIPLKDCPGVRRAQEALDIAASALDRGVGDSGDTAMREAFAALGPPVQNGVTQYCAPPN